MAQPQGLVQSHLYGRTPSAAPGGFACQRDVGQGKRGEDSKAASTGREGQAPIFQHHLLLSVSLQPEAGSAGVPDGESPRTAVNQPEWQTLAVGFRVFFLK